MVKCATGPASERRQSGHVVVLVQVVARRVSVRPVVRCHGRAVAQVVGLNQPAELLFAAEVFQVLHRLVATPDSFGLLD